jgi:type II secretion system protein C
MRGPRTTWQRAAATSAVLALCAAGTASTHAQRRAGGSNAARPTTATPAQPSPKAANTAPQKPGTQPSAAVQASQTAPSAPAAPPLALPLRLAGVIVDTTDPQRSVSLIKCSDNAAARAFVYAVGDLACSVAEVREIADDAIVVRDVSTGRLTRVALVPGSTAPGPLVTSATPEPAVDRVPPPAPAPPPSGVITVKLTRAQLDAYWANLPSLIATVQATPHYQESFSGQRSLDGFTLGTTAGGTLVEQLGLRAGDVVHDVNGDRLDNAAAAMRLLSVARDMTQARVRITRNGQPLTVQITVE